MPTSTESALWLLSAPSVRFWQQTAICPILLWVLVVELHLLNWARARAVHWISDKVTMKELEERCVYEWNFAANLVKILQRHLTCLTKHTGRTVWAKRSAMSGLSILKRAECWSVKFPGLDDFPHNKQRPCWESSCCDSWKLSFNCLRSCWRSEHQHRILPSNFYWKTSDVLRQCKIHACLLTDDQKENHLEISQELLVNANGNENFLKNIITGDETWVYECILHLGKNSDTLWIEGWPGPRADMDILEKRKIFCPCHHFNPNCPAHT